MPAPTPCPAVRAWLRSRCYGSAGRAGLPGNRDPSASPPGSGGTGRSPRGNAGRAGPSVHARSDGRPRASQGGSRARCAPGSSCAPRPRARPAPRWSSASDPVGSASSWRRAHARRRRSGRGRAPSRNARRRGGTHRHRRWRPHRQPRAGRSGTPLPSRCRPGPCRRAPSDPCWSAWQWRSAGPGPPGCRSRPRCRDRSSATTGGSRRRRGSAAR